MINGYTSSQCMACNRSRVLVARNAHGRILGTPHQRLTGVRTKAVIENHQGIQQIIQYSQIEKQSQPGISLIDITRDIRDIIATAGLRDGVVNILSRHTTTAVTINEAETRLMDDIRQVTYIHLSSYENMIESEIGMYICMHSWMFTVIVSVAAKACTPR